MLYLYFRKEKKKIYRLTLKGSLNPTEIIIDILEHVFQVFFCV